MRSCRDIEASALGIGRQLAVRNAVQQNLSRGRLDPLNGVLFGVTIQENIQFRNLRDPTAVRFTVEFDGEFHTQHVTPWVPLQRRSGAVKRRYRRWPITRPYTADIGHSESAILESVAPPSGRAPRHEQAIGSREAGASSEYPRCTDVAVPAPTPRCRQLANFRHLGGPKPT